MVVSHNLLAMNAQRQFNITGTNKKKSTEKLSSGYRINRAADDAAGLAISEKMRSQIRGLDQGARNTQDGISLLQVADGALEEVHDMLHRITELSVQAANDTNTKEDRSAIQKEINQITSEIDRISDTTEFNTRKLFKNDHINESNVQPSTGITDTKTDYYGVSNISCSGNPTDDSITTYTFSGNSSGLLINGDQISWSSIKASNGDTIDSGKANIYSCNYNGITFSFDTNKASTVDDICKSLKTAKVELNISSTSGEEAWADLVWRHQSAFDNSSGKTDYFSNVKNGHVLTADNNGVSWNGYRINWTDKCSSAISSDRQTLAEMLQKANDYPENINTGISRFWNLGDKLSLKVYFTTSDVRGKSYDEVTEILKNQLNGATFDIYNTGKLGSDFNACQFAAGEGVQDENGNMTLPYLYLFYSKGPITFSDSVWKDLGYDVYNIYDESLEVRTEVDVSDIRNTRVSISNGTNTLYASLTPESIEAINNQGLTYNKGETVTLEWAYKGERVQQVDIDAYINGASLVGALEALADRINNNSTGLINIDNPEHVYTKLAVSNLNLNLEPGSTSYSYEYIQPTLNERETGDSTEDPIDVANKDDRLHLWIQSGAVKGNGMFIEIGQMNSQILGIDNLDVSTYENAGKAIDAAGKATDIISSMRAKIGAQQNRLEHTYNNVTNTSENTQAAESRIRDTDMAKEMVELSKHSILEQAGTTMIAQANQSNQGVLNLLQ